MLDDDGNRWICQDCGHRMAVGSWEENGGYAFPTCRSCGSTDLVGAADGEPSEPAKRDIAGSGVDLTDG